MNKYFFFVFLFSFPLSSSVLEYENDNEELKSVMRDLRVSKVSFPYNSGEFPFYEPELVGVRTTSACYVGTPSFRREALLEQVFPGEDGRVRVENPSELPYQFHGRITMQFPKGEFSGSGVLVGPHHVLTAGHNLFSSEKGGWATSITFVPALNGEETPFGEAQGTILLSVENWVEGEDENYDFGIAILDQSIGTQTGWAGLLSTFDALLKSYIINVTGYPAVKIEERWNFTQMWTMSGLVQRTFNEQMTFKIDTSPGQSGGGVWIQLPTNQGTEYYVVGVHTCGTEVQGNENTGTRISSEKFKRLVGWMEEYQGKDFWHPGLPSTEEKEARIRYKTYKVGAKEGNPESQYQLAKCYKEGNGVRENPHKAFKWCKKAAEKGYRLAQRELVLYYKNGIGNEEGIILAFGLLLKLNEANDGWAQYNIGVLYQEGFGGISQDYAEAMKWYLRAADQNDAEAQTNIGLLYCNGYGVTQDYTEAMMWFKKAAKQNNQAAQNNIGWLYENGYGVSKDNTNNYAKAMKWYLKAAYQHNEEAQENVRNLCKIIYATFPKNTLSQ